MEACLTCEFLLPFSNKRAAEALKKGPLTPAQKAHEYRACHQDIVQRFGLDTQLR